MNIAALYRRTYADFARRWRLVLGWQLLVQMIGVATVAPLAGWLLNRVVARSGSTVVSNFDIAHFMLSPRGVLFVVLALAAAIAFHMAQFAGYTWISGHAIGQRSLTLFGTLGATLQRIGLLTRLGARMFLRVVLLALPFLAIVALVWFATLRGHDINYYLAERPPEWRDAMRSAAVTAAGFGFVVLAQFARWIYTMPIAMFYGRLGPRQILDASERMLDGRLLRTITPLLIWWGGLTAAAAALAWLGRHVTEPALAWAGMDLRRALPLVTLFLIVSTVFAFLYATLQFAVHQFLITRLYADQRAGPLLLPDEADVASEAVGRRRGLSATAVLVIVTLAGVAVGGWLVSRLHFKEDVAVTAHRGASLQAPENSLAAFRAAYAAGADYIELDVQRTADGAVVVLHDGDLMRLAGDPRKVAALNLADLQALDIGRKRGAAYAGERVPTLEQVIAYARGKLKLNIELKYNVPDPGLAPAVIELLRRENFLDQAVITSLDHAALQQVERLEPGLRTGLIVTASVGNVARVDTDFVSLNSAKAKPDLVRRAQAAGKQVHVWTVNAPEAMLRMIERDVDNVITDEPALLVRLMRERAALSPAEQLGLRLRVLFTDAPVELRDAEAVPEL
jgi:glycerophosphoryl diester phosphodiesterase